MQKITPFLWFNKEAGEAAEFYVSVFKGSRIKDKQIVHDTPSGTIEIITIELFGQEFTLMSAGPTFKINEAISFVVNCDGQGEVDYYWEKLTTDGGEESMCGWLKDKFGVSWQIIPKQLNELTSSPDKTKAARATQAMLKMKKIDIAELERSVNEAK